jgi:cytochrome c biogenesis protein CcdA
LGRRFSATLIGSVLMLVLVTLLIIASNSIKETETLRLREAKDQVSKEIGGYYRSVPVSLRVDNRTHLIYIYYNPCSSCDPDRRKTIQGSLSVWTSNVSSSSVQLEILNSYKSPNQTKSYLESFGIHGYNWGFTTLIIYRSSEAYILTPPFKDENVQKAISYLNYGIVHASVKTLPLSTPLVYALGTVSGLNPCFVALASAFLATSTQDQGRKVARRLVLVSLGLIYAYLIFFTLILANPGVASYLPRVTWMVALVLLGVGLLYLVEVTYDLYVRRWGAGSHIEAKIPIFRTPKIFKSRIRRSENSSGLYDFGLGAFFSLVKLPCIAAYLFVLLVNSTNQLADIAVFTLGVVSPIVLMGGLIGLGMVRINQLTELQFKGRIVQRAAIGIILIVSVIFIL